MKQSLLARTASDPFMQHTPMSHEATFNVLGVPIHFESNREWFLRVAEQAYGGLPAAGLWHASAPHLRMRLLANDDAVVQSFEQPPEPSYFGTDQMITVIFTPADALVCSLHAGSGFITVSPAMARFTYNVRYEMIEFATYRLVQQHLCPVGLHAGGIARGDRSHLLFWPKWGG